MCLFRAERQSAENALQLEINFYDLLESPCANIYRLFIPEGVPKKLGMLTFKRYAAKIV